MPQLPCLILHTMAALNGSSSRISSRGSILLLITLVYLLLGSAEAFSLDRTPLLIANRRTGRCRTPCTHFASNSPLFSSLPVTSDIEAGIQTPTPQSQPSRLQSFRQIVLPRILFVAALFLSGYRLGVNTGGSAIIDSATATVRRSSRRFAILSTALIFFILRDLWRSVPNWAKPKLLQRAVQDTGILLGIATKASAAEDDKDLILDADDISDFGNLGGKLSAVLAVLREKMPKEGDEDGGGLVSGLNLQFTFLALLQLMRQLKSRRAKERDELYAACGPPLTAEQLQPLPMGLEYADWAYDEDPSGKPLKELLDEQGYALLKHDKTAIPGTLGHYVAIAKDPKTKMALIGVKGTSTFEDLITDMCGAAVDCELEASFVRGGPTSIRAHDGILLSSRKLADNLQPLVENLLIPQGYRIQLVGHSLGAASAAMVAVFLRSRIDRLRNDDAGRLLSVLAFASPPNLDLASALACKPFCTTIVNNVDVIPRSNIAPLLSSIEVMKDVNDRLKEKGMAADSIKNAATLFKKLGEGKDGDLIMTADELTMAVNASMTKVGLDDPNHLYVAGNVYLLYDDWEEEIKRGNARSNENETEEMEPYLFCADHAVSTDCTAIPLRYIEWDGRLIDDHMAWAYRNSLKHLTQKCRKTT